MRAWQLDNFGLDNLRLGEVPTPTPKDDEVLIKVSAVSLNFRDKAIVDGIYEPEMIPKPLIPVSDAVGVVVAVGKNVTHLEEGDRVNSHLYSHWVDGLPEPNEPNFCYGAPLPGGLADLCATGCIGRDFLLTYLLRGTRDDRDPKNRGDSCRRRRGIQPARGSGRGPHPGAAQGFTQRPY